MSTPSAKASEAQRLAADPEASVWVTASAGTGKTKVLTDRILRLLLSGAAPQSLLCLTFTRAAASEMANRLNQKLADWAVAEESTLATEISSLLGGPAPDDLLRLARQLLTRLLDVPGGMRFQTIHAFCQSVLARFPLEADIVPHFTALDERGARETLFEAELALYGSGQMPPTVAVALERMAAQINDDELRSLVGRLIARRGELQGALARHGGLEGLRTALYRSLGASPDDSEDEVVGSAVQEAAFDGKSLRFLVGQMEAHGGKQSRQFASKIGQWLAAAPDHRVLSFDDYVKNFATEKGEFRKRLIDKPTRLACSQADDIVQEEYTRLIEVQDKRRAIRLAEKTSDLLSIANAIGDSYAHQKESRARLDYEDLILRVQNMLRRPDGMTAWVLYKMDEGIDHILVDEAQDTNHPQWHIIRAITDEFFSGLGREGRQPTIFAVGDRKQSIYGFQGADPEVFDLQGDHYRSQIEAGKRQWSRVPLNVSFRSVEPVLRAVDATFRDSPARDGVTRHGDVIRHISNRGDDAGLVEVWPLVQPVSTDERAPWKPPVEQIRIDPAPVRLARLLAEKIVELTNGGSYLPSQGRAIHPGDIMVLVRRRHPLVAPLVRALKEKGVPVSGVDRMVLTDQIAVLDLIALGDFLLLPEDELTLATVLKSPIGGLDDNDLFQLAYKRSENLWHRLVAKGNANGAPEPWKRAVGRLTALLQIVDYKTPYALFSEFLGAGGGRRDLVSRLGPDAMDPINEFLNQALRFENEQGGSLQAFLHWLRDGEIEIKRDLDHGAQKAVRIMTVHGAKGLQAPIVFLPDTVSKPRESPKLVWDHETSLPYWLQRKEDAVGVADRARDATNAAAEAEYRRLLYVAMTRAEDRLYVLGWEGTKAKATDDCWYGLVTNGLRAVGETARDDFLANHPLIESADVLRLSSAQIRDVSKESQSDREGEPALPKWATAPAPNEPKPPRPLIPSALDTETRGQPPRLGVDQQARMRRGSLIHTLLQWLPEYPDDARDEMARRFLARPGLALTARDQDAIRAEVFSVLADPACAPAFGPGSRAEVDLAALIGDTSIAVAARLDRLVVQDDHVLVIDFKTGTPIESAADTPIAYRRQLGVYISILRKIWPDRPVYGVLIWTEGPRVVPIPDGQLILPGS